MKRTVTIVLPDGYTTAGEFAKDCGFELADEQINLCAKIFDHKWLDPECVEIGCQSLVLKEECRQRRGASQACRLVGSSKEAATNITIGDAP